jgi:hypothetical protein
VSKIVFSDRNGAIYAVSREGDLLFGRDNNRDGTGDVGLRSVIGKGGWADLLNVFSGGDGIIYGISRDGNLLFGRDNNRDGTGDVGLRSVIGKGGWADLLNVFSGGDGIIYGISRDGNLLFGRDNNRDGTGDVGLGSVIGKGGWDKLKFVFSGGDGSIYGVSPEGNLLFGRDNNRNGTGDVGLGSVIGRGGWADLLNVFSGGDGIIYGISREGNLLFGRDNNRNGTGDVGLGSVIGRGGWDDIRTPQTPSVPLKPAFPITASRHDDVAGGHMETSITLYNTGRMDGVTRTWTNVDFSGFTGGVCVVLIGDNNHRLWVSGLHTYGVDGDKIPFKVSDRTEGWDEQVPQELLNQVRGVAIVQRHAPDPRLPDWLKTAGEALEEIKPIIQAIALIAAA